MDVRLPAHRADSEAHPTPAMRHRGPGPGAGAPAPARRVEAAAAEGWLSRHPGRPVREIMTAAVVTFGGETSIEEATQAMLEGHFSGAPVVDAGGRPIGIVSKTDLLEAWHGHVRGLSEASGGGPAGAGDAVPTGVVVGDIMVPYLLAAQDSSPISLAAALMAYEGVHRLLVLDEKSTMVGIVSSLDVLRWLAQLSGFCVERGDVPQALAPA